MAQRTTVQKVKDVLSKDYDKSRNASLQPYIDAATLVADRVNTCASKKGITLTSGELENIETWIAADFYTISDPKYLSKRTADSAASYANRSYLQAAYAIDYSGCLRGIIEGEKRARAKWLGRPPSEQTDYVDRD